MKDFRILKRKLNKANSFYEKIEQLRKNYKKEVAKDVQTRGESKEN